MMMIRSRHCGWEEALFTGETRRQNVLAVGWMISATVTLRTLGSFTAPIDESGQQYSLDISGVHEILSSSIGISEDIGEVVSSRRPDRSLAQWCASSVRSKMEPSLG